MKKTILLIEDNRDILENTAEILHLEGYEVLMASHGDEGFEMASSQLPDLIISDIQMPGINGYEVLSKIRTLPKTTHIPFIFLTASAQEEDIEKGRTSGAHGYLTKPFTSECLKSAILKVLS